MSQFNDTNRGAVFENAPRRTERSPDFDGEAQITADLSGQPVEVAAWMKEGRSKRFLSLSFKKPFDAAKLPKVEAGRGRLNAVAEKRSEKAPDFEGAVHVPAELAGEKFRIACWKDKSGNLDLRVEAPRPTTPF